MLRFEIESWEVGEKIEETDRQTDRWIFVNLNIDYKQILCFIPHIETSTYNRDYRVSRLLSICF